MRHRSGWASCCCRVRNVHEVRNDMTASADSPKAPATSARRGSRLLEWLWRGSALRKAREEQAAQRDLAASATRARIAAEVGAYALDPSGPWASGNAYHLAC